jgi:hypothetical protein
MVFRDIELKVKERLRPVMDALALFCDTPVLPPPDKKNPPPYEPGWFCYDKSQGWVSRSPNEFGYFVLLDFEAQQDEFGTYYPTCCAAYDATNQAWWHWYAIGEQVVEFPDSRLVGGQNVVAHDRRYLSCSYAGEDCLYIDTMQLGSIIGGLGSESKDGTYDGSLYRLWKTFEKQKDSGSSVPAWLDKCHPVNLADLSLRYLGIKMDKSIRDRLQNDPTNVTPESLWEYCSSDTFQTARLLQRLFTIVDRHFFASSVSWYGLFVTNGYRYYIDGLSDYLDTSEGEYEQTKARLLFLQNQLKEKAIAADDKAPYNISDDRWKLYTRGPNKGQPKWVANLSVDEPMTGNFAASLLLLRWGGKPVTLEKTGHGQPNWYCDGEPLPHPTGDGNLSSPLCPDYRGYAVSGHLSSDRLSGESLVKLFDLLESMNLWAGYRKQFHGIYTQKVNGLDVLSSGVNPCGTITRRANGLMVRLPKPNDKIGGSIMNHIFAPDGYVFVSADFDSQGSRIAAAALTDCRAGRHYSNEWSRAVLSGSKEHSTDVHSLTAQKLGLTRSQGKTLNCLAQNFGGINLAVNTLVKITGKPREECEKLAAQFFGWLKGADGVATSTFKNLEYLKTIRGLRTYLLGVKQPQSIDPEWLPTPRSFSTLRGNWSEQSGGVDEKHLLIACLDLLIAEHGLDAYFAFDIHDQIFYYSKVENAQKVAQLFDEALAQVMICSYERAAEFWSRYGMGQVTALEPLPQWQKFQEVKIGRSLGDLA